MSDDDVFVPTPEELEHAKGGGGSNSPVRRFMSRVVAWTFKPGVGEAKVVRHPETHPTSQSSADVREDMGNTSESPQHEYLRRTSVPPSQVTRRRVVRISDAVVKQRGRSSRPPSS